MKEENWRKELIKTGVLRKNYFKTQVQDDEIKISIDDDYTRSEELTLLTDYEASASVEISDIPVDHVLLTTTTTSPVRKFVVFCKN